MEQIEQVAPGRILYFDTDSVIYVFRPGVPDPPTGNFLGDLTSELKPDQHIHEFISLGAKPYGYQINDGKTCVKIKGFCLNGATDDVVAGGCFGQNATENQQAAVAGEVMDAAAVGAERADFGEAAGIAGGQFGFDLVGALPQNQPGSMMRRD